MATQNARQCGPCVHGLEALASEFAALTQRRAVAADPQRIAQLAAIVRGRGACGHPDGVSHLALSALETFPEEFLEHARHGACEACAAPARLPLPESGR
jgi:NADH:ubiquinone oxidoreductase subunit F (NADH-binding)